LELLNIPAILWEVGVGGDLHPESLHLAYKEGIFPWPIEDFDDIPWFCPDPRGVLEFSKLHIPKSLQKMFGGNAKIMPDTVGRQQSIIGQTKINHVHFVLERSPI
jgi:hypothetical protein